jgi:hypothetical protein
MRGEGLENGSREFVFGHALWGFVRVRVNHGEFDAAAEESGGDALEFGGLAVGEGAICAGEDVDLARCRECGMGGRE